MLGSLSRSSNAQAMRFSSRPVASVQLDEFLPLAHCFFGHLESCHRVANVTATNKDLGSSPRTA
jgi:hypothetical protein